MKKKLLLLLLATLGLTHFCFSQRQIKVGGSVYYITKQQFYLKEQNINGVALIFSYKNKSVAFSLTNSIVRNDTIFQKGVFSVDKKRKQIMCREFYSYDLIKKIDSSHRYYKQHNGLLVLTRYITYKNGSANLIPIE